MINLLIHWLAVGVISIVAWLLYMSTGIANHWLMPQWIPFIWPISNGYLKIIAHLSDYRKHVASLMTSFHLVLDCAVHITSCRLLPTRRMTPSVHRIFSLPRLRLPSTYPSMISFSRQSPSRLTMCPKYRSWSCSIFFKRLGGFAIYSRTLTFILGSDQWIFSLFALPSSRTLRFFSVLSFSLYMFPILTWS